MNPVLADKSRIRVLGHDPGNTNYGFSVIDLEIRQGMVHVEVIACGELPYRIKKLTEVATFNELRTFLQHAILDIRDYRPDYYAVERFMTRGIKGSLIEHVNMMIGMFSSAACRVKENKVPVVRNITLVNPGTWKKAAKQFFNLDTAYKICSTPPHELDATLIAIYAGTKVFGKKPFSDLDPVFILDLMHQIESKTTSKLIKRRRAKDAVSLQSDRQGSKE